MQRYRVNVPLLAALVIGSIVLLGGSYGLYKFQKARNSDLLLERDQIAREEGNWKKSKQLLVNYLQINQNDEDAMAQLCDTLIEVSKLPDAERQDLSKAIGQLETTVRNFPERDDLRRKLVDLYMEHHALKQATDHISQLLNRKPKDPELEAMRSKCYFGSGNDKAVDHAFTLIGYDPTTDAFDMDEAIAPGEFLVYSQVARKLRYDRLEQGLADRVIAQMVEANPESGMALLARGQYLENLKRSDEANEDIKKALELEPDTPAIIIANARLASRDDRVDEANKLLRDGLEKHPDNPGLYQTLADTATRQRDYEGAAKVCDEGIAAVKPEQSLYLMLQKARLLLQLNDLKAVKDTIKQMRDLDLFQAAFPDYLEAQVWMRDQRWFDSAKVFEKYQSFFGANQLIGPELNCLLGLCREKLGQKELAVEAFDRALQIEPKNEIALTGRQRVLGSLGGKRREGEGVSIYTALALELAKPESEQDWEAFDARCRQYIDQMGLSEGMLKVLQGEVEMRRGNYPDARKLLVEAYKIDPDNLGVRRAAVKLFAADPDQGPVKALGLLDKVVERFGDMPILRLERADLLSVINDEDLTDQLFALTKGTEDWTAPQQVQLWKGLANKFGRLRKEEERSECLRKVAELSPSDLPTLLNLFQVAKSTNDEEGMKAAQDSILKLVGSKEDPTWMFTEAQREMAAWRALGGQGDGLSKAKELVDRALNQREGWHELHNLKAELALARGDVQGALSSYDRAANLGRQDARELFQYIKLLMARGRYQDALSQMDKISRDSRLQLLGREYSECLLNVGRDAEATTASEAYAAQAPTNPKMQLWYGRFLSRLAAVPGLPQSRKKTLTDNAGKAFNAAVENDRNSADAWLALVGYYAATRQPIKADDTIREAQLVLIEDQSRLLFARCYEMVGRAIDAEALYKQALEEVDESQRARVSRLAAQFYLGPAYQRADKVDRAKPLVNQILKDVADGVIEGNNPHARWARSTAARLLASGGSYQELRDAENLLSSNVSDGVLPTEDRMLMAQILAPRPEPISRLKAATLLEEIGQNQKLSKKSELDLAKLYFALGEWRKCRQQMLNIIAQNPEDRSVRLAYLEMLLRRGGSSDIDQAVRQVKRLQEIAPKELSTREMLARVASAKGKNREAAATLRSVLPRSAAKITPEQIPLLQRVAARLVTFDDLKGAQQLNELAAKLGGLDEKLALAQFVGTHVDADQALDQLDSMRGEATPAQIVKPGLAIIRANDSADPTVTKERVDRVQAWLDRGLREDPELVALLLQQAECYDIQRDYDRAADAYRVLLDHEEVNGVGRAVVLNNLAYLLALAKIDEASISEAERYISEAVDLLGPNSEILDTRAVVAIADKRYDDAIADLDLAVIDNPTASKYFHLAVAHQGAGQTESAAASWQEAVDRGLSRDSVSRLEKEQYDQLKEQLSSAGLTSVNR
ncbi:tetratricopeptide repeat protein [Planctomycetes bacterium MalM25]|nr:tetratricopeptide repeat protein [Planctomycetes bacterium MalM25]